MAKAYWVYFTRNGQRIAAWRGKREKGEVHWKGYCRYIRCMGAWLCIQGGTIVRERENEKEIAYCLAVRWQLSYQSLPHRTLYCTHKQVLEWFVRVRADIIIISDCSQCHCWERSTLVGQVCWCHYWHCHCWRRLVWRRSGSDCSRLPARRRVPAGERSLEP